MSKFKRSVEIKMDSARALGLMGFSGTRLMDRSAGNDPKDALDKALFVQMQILVKRKRDAIKKEKEAERRRNLLKGIDEPIKEVVKSVDDWSSSSCNPYLFNAEEIKPKPASGASKFKSRDEKYAEDILRLHEAYQFLMKKHVVAAKTKVKLSHNIGTIGKVTMLLKGSNANDDEPAAEEGDNVENVETVENDENEEEDGDDNNTNDEEVEKVPCGACQMMKDMLDITDDDVIDINIE